jgi:transcriptional regulator with XRE-family HTH domain
VAQAEGAASRYSRYVASAKHKALNAQPAEPVLGAILKRARVHKGLSLRDVERRTGVPNAHLSQIERGVIRKPDPAIIFELTSAYGLDFALLAEWAGYLGKRHDSSSGMLEALVREFVNLDPVKQAEALAFVEELNKRT